MKIGYDAKRAFLNNTGLGNYSRWLIQNIAKYHPENLYCLYTPKIKSLNRLSFLKYYDCLKTITPTSTLFTSWWRTKGIMADLKAARIDIYHGLSHELPIGINRSRIKSVVTIHDLIYLHFPHQFGWISRKIYSLKVKYACRVANKIVAISEHTKNDLIRYLHINPDKIEVIYQGVDPSFKTIRSKEENEKVREKYNLPNRFLLSVSTIEERKNLLLTVKALKLLNSCIPLVVVGKSTPYTAEIKAYITANELDKQVVFLDNVEFQDLPSCYQLASAFIYPSIYEGFGIPILEALYSKVPVIAATGSCLEEAGGVGSIYIDPKNEQQLADKIKQVLTDEALRNEMIAKGLAHTQNFADTKLTNQLIELYKTI